MHSLTVPKLGVNSQQAADLSAEPAQHWVRTPGPGCTPHPAQPRPGRRAPPRDPHPVPADCQGDRCGPERTGTDGGLSQPRPGDPSAHPVCHVYSCPSQSGRRTPAAPAASSSTLQPPPPVLSTWLADALPSHHAPHPPAQLQRLPQHCMKKKKKVDPHTCTKSV